jgi:hypothetical protein
MTKNRDKNINPAKGISIIIKLIFNNHNHQNQKRKEDIDVLTHYQR